MKERENKEEEEEEVEGEFVLSMPKTNANKMTNFFFHQLLHFTRYFRLISVTRPSAVVTHLLLLYSHSLTHSPSILAAALLFFLASFV